MESFNKISQMFPSNWYWWVKRIQWWINLLTGSIIKKNLIRPKVNRRTDMGNFLFESWLEIKNESSFQFFQKLEQAFMQSIQDVWLANYKGAYFCGKACLVEIWDL